MKALLNEKIVRTGHYQELMGSWHYLFLTLDQNMQPPTEPGNWSGGPRLPNKGTHLGLTRGVQSSLFGSHLEDGTRAAWPKLKRAIGDGKEENERAAETPFPPSHHPLRSFRASLVNIHESAFELGIFWFLFFLLIDSEKWYERPYYLLYWQVSAFVELFRLKNSWTWVTSEDFRNNFVKFSTVRRLL